MLIERPFARIAALTLLVALHGCTTPIQRDAGTDAGASPSDASAPDASTPDAGDVADDGGRDDGGPPDSGIADAGPPACESGSDVCGADPWVCTPLNALENCGACASTCALDHATETCATGNCAIERDGSGTPACDTDWGDCDDDDATGCEENLTDNDAHCGACDNACSAGEQCEGSACLPLEWDVVLDAATPIALTTDSAGDVYALGTFTGTVDFGGTSLSSSGGSQDLFLARYTPTGVLRWVRGYGGAERDTVGALGRDDNGNLYVGGQFHGTTDIGGLTDLGGHGFDHGGADAGLIFSTDPTGTPRWARSFSSAIDPFVYGLAPYGTTTVRLYVAGMANGSTDVGCGSISTGGGMDGLLIAYDADTGGCFWNRTLGGGNYDRATGVGVDASGNVYVAAQGVSSPFSFASGTSATKPGGTYAGYVARYAPTGTVDWYVSLGSSGNTRTWGLAVGGSAVVTTGSFDSTTNVQGTTASASTEDALVAAYATSGGAGTFVDFIGGSGEQVTQYAAVAPSGQIWACGYFDGPTTIGATTHPRVGGYDTFCVRYGAAGSILESFAIGSSEFDSIRSVVVDDANNLFFATLIGGPTSVDLGLGTVTLSSGGGAISRRLAP